MHMNTQMSRGVTWHEQYLRSTCCVRDHSRSCGLTGNTCATMATSINPGEPSSSSTKTPPTSTNPGESSSSSTKTPPTPTMVTVTDVHFTRLMKVTKESRTAIDAKLAAFKAELQDSQECAATSAARKVVWQEPYSFKKKSHEEQHKVNQNIDKVLIKAKLELETVSSDSSASLAVKKAQNALTGGRKLIAERQKLIKIADRSELGWAVVSEYTADELSDGRWTCRWQWWWEAPWKGREIRQEESSSETKKDCRDRPDPTAIRSPSRWATRLQETVPIMQH